jgi:preprotein translocase subunit SecF
MDWMRYRYFYFLISGVALGFAIYSIVMWGFKYSIDFTGGSVAELKFEKQLEVSQVQDTMKKISIAPEVKDIKLLEPQDVELKFSPDIKQEQIQSILEPLGRDLENKPTLVRFENVGPTLSQEILRKTLIGMALASLGILLWVAYQFKSLSFGISAILAMLHDSIILLGTFAILGHTQKVEIDILFVTAVLTVLSFSVHDTIVVYDRIRESMRRHYREPMYSLANRAVTETFVRSLNNSLVIIYMLFALFLLGGSSIKWFVFALLVGTVSGAYSSPFVAVPLLVTWDKISHWWKKRKS